MIDFNSAIVPSGSNDRADLLRMADQILYFVDGKAPPTEVQPDQITGPVRYRNWSADALMEIGLEPGHFRLTKAGIRPANGRTAEVVDYGTTGLEELLATYPGLSALEREVAFRVLDGRERSRGYLTDVADEIGITPNAARVYWNRAKGKLKTALEAEAA